MFGPGLPSWPLEGCLVNSVAPGQVRQIRKTGGPVLPAWWPQGVETMETKGNTCGNYTRFQGNCGNRGNLTKEKRYSFFFS